MGNKINDPIARLMGLRYKSHPWHGLDVGPDAPNILTAFIEMVPTDTVKYELDKSSGYIKIDRPQKYSSSPESVTLFYRSPRPRLRPGTHRPPCRSYSPQEAARGYLLR